MDCTDSKSVGGHVESAEYVLASHFAAVMQVQTSAVVHSSPGEDQELKIDTCALGSGSSPSSESERKKETSTTTAHSTELPTTEATTSRGGNALGENVDERVLLLETELVEAIEAKNMYKVQLQSAIAQQHNGQDEVQQGIGNVDQLIELQKRTKSLEAELRDMQDRYSSKSLRFAEVEAQREELVM
ncbi:unnamed protein product, partial [Sphagnum jensenii]